MASLNSCEPITGYLQRAGSAPSPETGRIFDWIDRFGSWFLGLSVNARPQRPSRPQASGATVLVVEDDASLRHMIRWTLEHNGYSTIVAHHGGEAMHAVRERGGQIDLLDGQRRLEGRQPIELRGEHDQHVHRRPRVPQLDHLRARYLGVEELLEQQHRRHVSGHAGRLVEGLRQRVFEPPPPPPEEAHCVHQQQPRRLLDGVLGQQLVDPPLGLR